MTVSSGFFNSVNHDRLYNAEQLSSIFDGIIIDGVYENFGDAFMVTAYPDANDTVIVGTGRAWFDHTWTYNDSQFSITLDPPNDMLGRTDAIVIDVNRENDTRNNSIKYIKGSESNPDMPPDFIDTDLHKQYPICYITRGAGSSAPVSQSSITITVGTSVCPIVSGILESQNLDNLMAQLNSEFMEWWDGIKDVLDENTVTNLQNQIDELKEKIEGDDALVGLLTKPVYETYSTDDYNITVSSFNLSNPVQSPIDVTDQVGTQYENSYRLNIVGYTNAGNISGIDNGISFLPDGKIIKIYYLMAVPKDYEANDHIYGMRYDIYTSDGVLYKSGDYLDEEIGGNYSSSDSGFNRSYRSAFGVFYDWNFDSYPISFSIMYRWGKFKRTGTNVGTLRSMYKPLHFKISSSGVLQATAGTLIKDDANYSGYLDSSTTHFFSTENTFSSSYKSPDDSWYFLNSGGLDDYSRITHLAPIKVNSEGVITSKPLQKTSLTDSNNLYYGSMQLLLYNGMDARTIYGVEDGGVTYFKKNPASGGNYINFDEGYMHINGTSLDINFYSDDQLTSHPFNYDVSSFIVDKSYSLYKLKGTEGFYSVGNIEGEDNTSTEQVIYENTYIGASNAAKPIYNGDVVALKSGSQYIGVDGNNNYFSIGTNGGIAVSNKTNTTSLSVDSSKIRIRYVPVYSDDNKYMFITQNDSGSNSNTIYKISKQ